MLLYLCTEEKNKTSIVERERQTHLLCFVFSNTWKAGGEKERSKYFGPRSLRARLACERECTNAILQTRSFLFLIIVEVAKTPSENAGRPQEHRSPQRS